MKHIIVVILLPLSIAINSCHSATAPGEEQEVIQFERDVAKALVVSDSVKVDRYFEKDYIGSSNLFTESKQDIMKSLGSPMDVAFKDLEMKAKVYATSAVVTGIWEVKLRNAKPIYLRFTDMLVKEKDGWKIAGSVQNTVPFWSVREAQDSELVAVPVQPCETESTLKSKEFDRRTYIGIKNQTTDTIIVYWINYEGKRDPSPSQIRKVAPGKDFALKTFVTHPFVIMGSSGKCYGIYTGMPEPGIAVIK